MTEKSKKSVLFPSVVKVGEYLNYENFAKQRIEVAQWVHIPNVVDNILKGEYRNIKPFHIEISPTYECNFYCAWCNCSKSRESSHYRQMRSEELIKIVDICAMNDIGIQWTGGEPLCHHSIIDAVVRANNLGVRQCLFTNGSLLDDKRARKLLKTNLTFIRISLNACNSQVHSVFHGNINAKISKAVVTNLENLLYLKLKLKSKVLVGVSLVLDDTNVSDYINTLGYLFELCVKYKNAMNYIVVRPVNSDFQNIEYSITEGFNLQFEKGYNFLNKFSKLGVNIVFPNNNEDITINRNQEKAKCLGCSFFSEISPNGDLFLCSEKYGDNSYVIGNVFDNFINEIWMSKKKRLVERKKENCFSSGQCPSFSRGSYFNSILNQIEDMRQTNDMFKVKEWIDNLIITTKDVHHTFFI